MRVTQGTFSFLPDLTDEQIDAQIKYSLAPRLGDVDRVHRRPAPAQRLLGAVGPAGLRHEGGGLREHPARGSRRARGVPGALHQGDRVRPDPRPADDGARVHRQPAVGREARSSSTASRARAARNRFRLVPDDAAPAHRRNGSSTQRSCRRNELRVRHAAAAGPFITAARRSPRSTTSTRTRPSPGRVARPAPTSRRRSPRRTSSRCSTSSTAS